MARKLEMKLRAGALALCGVSAAGAVLAQGYPKEGPFDYVSCYSGTNRPIEFSKTHRASASEFTGTITSAKPGTPFENLSFHCIALATSFAGKGSGLTVCETMDKDGDKYLTYFSAGADGTTTRETVSGTGKFDGMTAKGASVQLGPFPSALPGTVQACSHQTGTYKLK